MKGNQILVDTLMPGPNEARCCPGMKKQLQFRWQGAKRVVLKKSPRKPGAPACP